MVSSDAAGEDSYARGDTSQLALITDRTLWGLFEQTCRERVAQEALVCTFENVQLTFAQMKLEVDRLAAGLYATGVSAGDRVLLWGANYANMAVAVFACCRLGAVFACANPSLDPSQMLSHLTQGAFKAIICFPTAKAGVCYRTLASLCPELANAAKGKLSSRTLPALTHVIMAEEDHKLGGTYTLSEVFGLARPANLEKLAKLDAPTDVHSLATIQFTTGATGEPKPAMLSHYQVINSCLVAGKRLGFDQPNEVLCCPMPIFRGPVLCLSAVAIAVFGVKLVFPSPKPVPAAIFQAIVQQKCTSILSNPIAFQLMMRLPMAKKFDLSSLTKACLVGESLSPEIMTNINNSTSITNIVVGVFVTEVGCMPVMFPEKGKADNLLTTIGKVAPHFEVKIVNIVGSTAKKGCLGEIYVKPINGSEFLGYYNQPELSKGYFLDGWMRTGDVGVMDADGYISLLGQYHELVFDEHDAAKPPIRPWPLEKCLSAHPMIIGAQVVSAPSSSDLCACVVVKDKTERKVLDTDLKEELLNLCKEEKIHEPKYILIMKDFPRTPTRKVQKYKLKEMVADLIKEQYAGN